MGIFPDKLRAMRYSKNYYQEALDTIEYSNLVKQKICGLFADLVINKESNMIVKNDDYQATILSIKELIDDMFYEQIISAKMVIWEYELGLYAGNQSD